MSNFSYKGVTLTQSKDPALSRELREFIHAEALGQFMNIAEIDEPLSCTPKELLEVARKAGIVDERDGRLLAEKLEKELDKQVDAIAVDAMDDEPYISSQLNPILKNQKLAQKGLELCCHILGAKEAYFAVYKNLTDLEIRIPKQIGSYSVRRFHGRYPAEHRLESFMDEEAYTVRIGAGSILHLARAIYYRKPQNTAFITVAGDCVKNPANMEVSLGLTVTQVLERCGLLETPHRVVLGGSMTGVSIEDTDAVCITPTTRAVLAFREDLVQFGFSCIGCGRCVRFCPQGLNPYLLYRSVQQSSIPQFAQLNAHHCIRCGTCSYICPSKLDLSETIYASAREFKPRVDAYRSQQERAQRYEDTRYARYFSDYQLGQAIRRHQADKRALQAEYTRQQKEAAQMRQTRDQEIDQRLQQAQQDMDKRINLAQQRYYQTIVEHRALKQRLRADLEKLMKEREKTYMQSDKAVEQMQDRREIAAERAGDVREMMQEEMHRILEQELYKWDRQVQRYTKKENAQEQLKHAKEMRTKAEKAQREVEEQYRTFIGKIEKDTEAYMKNNAEAVRLRCEERRKQAENIIKNTEENSEQELERSREKIRAAQKICEEDTEKARAEWEEKQKEALQEAKMVDEQFHIELESIDRLSLQTRAEMDETLRAARTAALQAALDYAGATADLMGRDIMPEDFVEPEHLLACEEELLSLEDRLSIEDQMDTSMEQAQQNVEELLAVWKDVHLVAIAGGISETTAAKQEAVVSV